MCQHICIYNRIWIDIIIKKLSKKYEWNKKQIGKWTIDRIIKTLSGYWIILFLALIICQLIDGKTGTVLLKKGPVFGITQIVVNFLGIISLVGMQRFIGPSWYMSVAILYIFSIPYIIKAFKKLDIYQRFL